MNVLRARGGNIGDWWEIELLDLRIVADGATEAEMLRQLAHEITCHYHLALASGTTPFVSLLTRCDGVVADAWEEDNKKLNSLGLSEEVWTALSMVLHTPRRAAFGVNAEEVQRVA
jgi:hypothetical protein